MKIAVVGTGYVGLVTGTCFAETGNDVTCVDIDKKKVEKLSSGQITIYEPGLEKLFLRNVKEERLRVTTSLSEGIKDAEIVFLALPTPPGEDGSADLKYILGVAKDLGELMTDYKVIVDKSTVPVGTAEKVYAAIAKNFVGDFDVVSNPEFLREGVAVEDFMKPDRVVLGSNSEHALSLMKELYSPFVRTENPILVMDNRSAEMTKYAANAFLATRISFINQVANLCEKAGADVSDVRRGIGFDRRIGHYFLFPGVGYGGSCFPKDVRAVIRTAEEYDMDFSLLKEVEVINEKQKELLVNKVFARFGKDLRGRKFAIWGLAFKPRTDDMREAPSIVIIEALLKAGAEIAVHDPEALARAREVFGDRVSYHRGNYDALPGADALLIVTEWNEFRRPDFARVRELMKSPIIFDGRNLYELSVMKQEGFMYYPVGRSTVTQ